MMMVLADVAGVFFTVSLTLYLELNRPPVSESLVRSVAITSLSTSFAGVCFKHFLIFLNNILYITVYDDKFYILIASSVTSALISKIVKIMYILSTISKYTHDLIDIDDVNIEEITADEVMEEQVEGEQEEVKAEEVKAEEVKAEEVKAEEVKAEEVKEEEVKEEEVKEEEVKEEEVKEEELKTEEITSADSVISYFQ